MEARRHWRSGLAVANLLESMRNRNSLTLVVVKGRPVYKPLLWFD